MGAFGRKVTGRTPADRQTLANEGIEIFLEKRGNGQLCLQIRPTIPKKWRLKSSVVGQFGKADIVYLPCQES
jgi:hypothetical protein